MKVKKEDVIKQIEETKKQLIFLQGYLQCLEDKEKEVEDVIPEQPIGV
jgi:hypothetical protein